MTILEKYLNDNKICIHYADRTKLEIYSTFLDSARAILTNPRWSLTDKQEELNNLTFNHLSCKPFITNKSIESYSESIKIQLIFTSKKYKDTVKKNNPEKYAFAQKFSNFLNLTVKYSMNLGHYLTQQLFLRFLHGYQPVKDRLSSKVVLRHLTPLSLNQAQLEHMRYSGITIKETATLHAIANDLVNLFEILLVKDNLPKDQSKSLSTESPSHDFLTTNDKIFNEDLLFKEGDITYIMQILQEAFLKSEIVTYGVLTSLSTDSELNTVQGERAIKTIGVFCIKKAVWSASESLKLGADQIPSLIELPNYLIRTHNFTSDNIASEMDKNTFTIDKVKDIGLFSVNPVSEVISRGISDKHRKWFAVASQETCDNANYAQKIAFKIDDVYLDNLTQSLHSALLYVIETKEPTTIQREWSRLLTNLNMTDGSFSVLDLNSFLNVTNVSSISLGLQELALCERTAFYNDALTRILDFVYALNLAQILKGYALYFPVRLDARSRLYKQATLLSPTKSAAFSYLFNFFHDEDLTTDGLQAKELYVTSVLAKVNKEKEKTGKPSYNNFFLEKKVKSMNYIGLDVSCQGPQLISSLFGQPKILFSTNLIKKGSENLKKQDFYAEIQKKLHDRVCEIVHKSEKGNKGLTQMNAFINFIADRNNIKGFIIRYNYSEGREKRISVLLDYLQEQKFVFVANATLPTIHTLCSKLNTEFTKALKDFDPIVYHGRDVLLKVVRAFYTNVYDQHLAKEKSHEKAFNLFNVVSTKQKQEGISRDCYLLLDANVKRFSWIGAIFYNREATHRARKTYIKGAWTLKRDTNFPLKDKIASSFLAHVVQHLDGLSAHYVTAKFKELQASFYSNHDCFYVHPNHAQYVKHAYFNSLLVNIFDNDPIEAVLKLNNIPLTPELAKILADASRDKKIILSMILNGDVRMSENILA